MKQQKMLITLFMLLVFFSVVLLYAYSLRTPNDVLNSENTQTSLEPILSVPEDEHVDFTLIADEYSHAFIGDLNSPAYAYNQQIPGPLLEVDLGDTKRIAVINNLDVETTVHFHGIIPENAMDGIPQITQEAIASGEYFIYEINFSDPGLFWYHSHVQGHEQVERGLQGALIVRSPQEDIFETLEEQVLVIDDVLLQENGHFYPFTAGRMHGRFGNLMLVNGKNNPSFNFNASTFRLRIVNSANARSFNIHLPESNMTVLSDGIGFTQAYNSELITIHPGERYDVIVQTAKNFQAEIVHLTRQGNIPLANINTGDHSTDFDTPLVTSNEQEYFELLERDVDEYITLRGIHGMGTLQWTINSFVYPFNPYRLSWKQGVPLKLQISNSQAQAHPMHFHGQKFFILSRNGERTNDFSVKDTVMLSSYETVEIAFIPEVSGDWVFHCHILEHAEAGMLGILSIF